MPTVHLKAYEPTRQRALEILRLHPESISAKDAAMKYGCFKLTSYISDLRRAGYQIEKIYDGRPGHWSYKLTDKVVPA